MNIAYTIGLKTGETDLLLAHFADRLAEMGVRTCGTVQINTERPDCHACDMDVRVLPGGPDICISQSLGKHASGCRLDPDALEQAVTIATRRLAEGADILIINKFGKHEANGRGFRELIAEALANDVAVIVGTNKLNEEAFLEFTGREATLIRPDLELLMDWFDKVCQNDPMLSTA